jgi:hypothetical protein
LGVFVDRAGEESLAEGAEGDEADPKFLQGGQDVLFGLPPPERVLALVGGDRLDRVRTTDRPCARFREAEVLDLALPDQVLYGASDLLDRHVRIDAMLVEKIDTVGLEASQRPLGDLTYPLGPAVETA